MRLFETEDREDLRKKVKQDERHNKNTEGTEKSFLERLHVMGYYRQMVVHVPGKGERECLSANNDIPPHHKDAEHDEKDAYDGPSDRQPRSEKEDERYEVPEAVLEDKYAGEIFVINNAP